MLLTLKVTTAQAAAVKAEYKERHFAYYAQPHGFRRTHCPAAYELFAAPAGELNCGYNEAASGKFGWVTSGGNVVMFDPSAGTVTFVGARHGISPLYVLESPESLEVIHYESSMHFLKPFETLPHFANRAALDSNCPYARGLALLKSGKPLQFLHAEGLPVYEIVGVYKECVTRGYITPFLY